jgi:outer membrane protein assembly factor BamA
LNWTPKGPAVVAAVLMVLLVGSARGDVDPNSMAVGDSLVAHNTSIKFFPYAYYTPETEFAVGAGGIATFYTGEGEDLRPSKVVLSGYYTTTKQYLITINPELYFSRNQYFAGMNISFGHYVDKFYGIGNDTPDLGTERYVADRNGVEIEVETPPLFFISDRAGLVYDFEYSEIVDVQENPYLQDDEVTGSTGGTVSGLGGGWIWDRRDHSFYPTHGDFHELTFVLYTEALGSDYTYWTLEHDNRRYITLAPDKVLAIQVYVDLVLGDAPFDRLPALGGQHRMRGYFEGRYRDNSYLMGQVEYRQVLSGRWGYVVFGAIGDVAPDLTLFKG